MSLSIKKKAIKKAVSVVTMVATVVCMSGVASFSLTSLALADVVDGALIKSNATNPDGTPTLKSLDVYIVKLVETKKFKRLMLNPTVFESYGHLNWGDIQTVSQAVMDEYTTSGLVRVDTDPDEKVYAMAPDGDIGSKSWVNVSSEKFLSIAGSEDGDSIYTINATDAGNYTAVGDITGSAELETFYSAGTLPEGLVVSGDLTVTLSSNTASSTTLTKGSVGNSVLAFNVAVTENVTLNTVKFTRTGVGLSTDYSNVYIYDGDTRLKTGRSINSDTNTVEFTGVGLDITGGETKTLYVKIDVYSSATAGDTNILGIASSSDITFSAGTVSGTFPVNGNSMSIGAQSVGTVTVANGTSLSKPSLGESGAKVATFKITAGTNNVQLEAVTLVQNGSFSNTGFSNLVLKQSSTEIATTAAMVGDKAVFVLGTPFAITKSQNRTFDVYADLSGGKTTDTVRFYLEESTDITVTDLQYGQGSGITNSLGSTAAYCVGASASNTCPTAGSLQGGTLTVVDNGPAADNVATNTTNVELLNFNITSTRNVTLKDYDFTLTATNKANGTVTGTPAAMTIGTESAAITSTAHGLAVGDYIIMDSDDGASYSTTIDIIGKVTTVTDANTIKITPVSGTDLTVAATPIWSTILRINGFRVVDIDTDNAIYSSSTDRYFYNGTLSSAIAATDDFDVTEGQTRKFSMRVDIHNYSSGTMTLNGALDFSTASRVKDNDANEYIAVADIVPNTLTGKNMTTNVSALTVALSSTPVSATKVKGTQDVDVLGISLTAGSAGDATMTSIIVRLFADTDTTFDNGEGDTAANSIVESISLYNGSTLVAGPKSLTLVGTIGSNGGYYKATFDGLTHSIPAGVSQKLTARVNIKNTISSTTYLAVTVIPASDVTAEDADGNTLTIANTVNGGLNEDDTDTAVDDTTPPVVFTISTGGTLTVNVEGSPSAALVVAGSTEVVMAKYKASAVNEAFVIEKLQVAADNGVADFAVAETDDDNDIVRVGVREVGGTIHWSNLVAGIASFSGLGITVPVDGNVYVEIVADLNTIAAGATSGEDPRLGIYQIQTTANTFRAVGVGSSDVKTYTTMLNTTVSGEENIKAMVLRETVPTIAKASGVSTTLVNGTNTLLGFTVAADAAEAVSLKRVAVTVTGSDNSLTVNAFKLYRGSTNITDNVLIYKDGVASIEGSTDVVTDTSANTIYIVWDGTTEEIISAGTSNTYLLKTTIAGASTGESISSYIADDSSALTTNTGIIVLGGFYDDTVDGYYHAGTTAVAADDIRITAMDSYAGVNTGTAAVDGTSVLSIYGNDVVDVATTFTYTLGTTSWAGTGWTVTDADGTGNGEATQFKAVNDTNGNVIQASGITAGDGTTVIVTVTRTDGTVYTSGSLVATGNSDLGLTVTASTTHNLLWSDNSAASHAFTTADWTNGYLVTDLATDSQTLSY